MPPQPVPPESDKQSVFLWVTYKPEEVNDGYWLVYRELGLPKTMISVFCTTFALGVGGVSANLGSFEPINGLILMGLAAFVFPPLLSLYAYLAMRGRLAKSYVNRPNFHFPMMYTLSPLGCQVEYASGAGLLDWRHFTMAIESPTAFCLASSMEDVFVLPKRCLGGEAEMAKVRELIKAHVREFRRARGRKVDIDFEKAAIQNIINEGIDEVVRVAEEAEAKNTETSSAAGGGVSAELKDLSDQETSGAQTSGVQISGAQTSGVQISGLQISGLQISGTQRSGDEISSDETAVAVPYDDHEHSPALQFSSPLKSGLAVEISYQPGEILRAEKIYFFRKRLIALAILYIAYLILMPVSFLAIGYIWGLVDYCKEVLNQIRPLVVFIIPLFFFQAALIYLIIRRRTKISEDFTMPFVFQFTEEGCGVRAGERYAVLAWWHFRECWETEDQFLVLVGQRGHAMYVIPKRVFPDQAGLRYLKQLLQRKIPKYRDLIG
jgi:hypothetical protein